MHGPLQKTHFTYALRMEEGYRIYFLSRGCKVLATLNPLVLKQAVPFSLGKQLQPIKSAGKKKINSMDSIGQVGQPQFGAVARQDYKDRFFKQGLRSIDPLQGWENINAFLTSDLSQIAYVPATKDYYQRAGVFESL